MGPEPLPQRLAAPGWQLLAGMVLVLDRHGQAQFGSASVAVALGSGDAALLGAGWQAAFDAASQLLLREALAQGVDFLLPLRLAGDAAARSLECNGHWLSAAGHYVCLLRDATAQLAQQPVQSQAALFRLLADNVPVLIAYYRASDLQCQFANTQYARTFGFDEVSIIGRRFGEVIGEAAARQIQPQVDRMLQQREAVAYERELPAPGGGVRWIEVNLLPHVGDDGLAVGAFVLISDITKHRLAERAVRESEERMAKFMQASAEGIVFHVDGVITDANPALCALTGYALDELLGRKTIEFVPSDQLGKVQTAISAGLETSYESVLLDKQQRRIPVEYIVRTMLRNGEPSRMTIVRDIRDRQAVQARIHHLAHHDPLTGLPNRMSFMDQLGQLMAGYSAQAPRLALLFVDLDHFKRVNDSLGHLAGDTLLRTVAARITASLRGTDIVARFGGDEFIVLLTGLPDGPAQRSHAEEVARKLLVAVEAPVMADGRPISVTPSVGIAMVPGDGDTPDALIKNADAAMYQAKARGRATFEFFDHGIAHNAYAALVLEGQLAQALERGEFELHFQPQVRAGDGSLVGAEALIRWNHPERGLLLPDAFIPVAERQRLMLPIGQWVLQQAMQCAQRWRAMGLRVSPVAVNLSTVQFHSAGFIEAVMQVLPEQGLQSGLLELELTERMLMDDLDKVKRLLEHLQRQGIRISVDDFGTGYSSLAHLKALPIDKLKIDRSFVHDLPGDRDSAAIVRAIIQMGRSLGMTVIAEGVETAAQRDFLAGHGCDELQGLLISAPLPVAQFEAWALQRQAASPPTST